MSSITSYFGFILVASIITPTLFRSMSKLRLI